MKKFLLAGATFFGSMVVGFSQDNVEDRVAQISQPPNRAVNTTWGIGFERLQNRGFSERIESLGKSPIPEFFFFSHFGVNIQGDKWTYLKSSFYTAKRNDFGDVPGLEESFSFGVVTLGTGYNFLPSTSMFRLETGVGLVYGDGKYSLDSDLPSGSFDEAIGNLEINSIMVKQNNYGLNLHLFFGRNPFYKDRGDFEVAGVELGTNLMFIQSSIRPNLPASPQMDLSSIYFKLIINMITW